MVSATETYTIPTAYVAPASTERSPDELFRLVPQNQNADDRGLHKVAGVVTGTTARVVVDRAIQSGQLELGKDEKLCLFTAQSHKAGGKLLCDGALHFYFGDIDLIEAYRSEHVGECEVDRAEAPLSYEPYPLLVPSQDPKFRAKFVAAVHEIFADGTAAGRFAHHFPGLQRSTALTMLCRINSIP